MSIRELESHNSPRLKEFCPEILIPCGRDKYEYCLRIDSSLSHIASSTVWLLQRTFTNGITCFEGFALFYLEFEPTLQHNLDHLLAPSVAAPIHVMDLLYIYVTWTHKRHYVAWISLLVSPTYKLLWKLSPLWYMDQCTLDSVFLSSQIAIPLSMEKLLRILDLPPRIQVHVSDYWHNFSVYFVQSSNVHGLF